VKSAFSPVRRGTLWIPHTGPAHDQERGHLFIILTDRSEDGEHLLVPVRSVGRTPDRTCLLGPGDHRFFTRLSFVSYAQMRIYSAATLIAQVSAGVIHDRGLLNERIFARICSGIEQSRLSAPRYKAYYAAQTKR